MRAFHLSLKYYEIFIRCTSAIFQYKNKCFLKSPSHSEAMEAQISVLVGAEDNECSWVRSNAFKKEHTKSFLSLSYRTTEKKILGLPKSIFTLKEDFSWHKAAYFLISLACTLYVNAVDIFLNPSFNPTIFNVKQPLHHFHGNWLFIKHMQALSLGTLKKILKFYVFYCHWE